MTKLTKYWF